MSMPQEYIITLPKQGEPKKTIAVHRCIKNNDGETFRHEFDGMHIIVSNNVVKILTFNHVLELKEPSESVSEPIKF